MDITKAFSVNNGIIIDEDNVGPFYTGGASSPVGQDLPRGQTLYTQSVSNDRVIIWQRYGAGVNDWRMYPAQDLSFDPSNSYRPTTTNVKTALIESKNQLATTPQSIVTSAGGTTNLTVSSLTFQIITGTATGHSILFPSSTTIPLGSEYQIYNNSSQSVDIKNGAGTVLFTLITQDFVVAKLEQISGAAGSWVTIVTSASASGITSYSVGSDTGFVTGNGTDTLITGMTVMPVSGRYQCIYSADILIGKNNSISETVFYSGGVAVPRSRRKAQGVGGNFQTTHTLLAEITVNGSQAVDVRVNVSTDNITVNQRRMILTRLGS